MEQVSKNSHRSYNSHVHWVKFPPVLHSEKQGRRRKGIQQINESHLRSFGLFKNFFKSYLNTITAFLPLCHSLEWIISLTWIFQDDWSLNLKRKKKFRMEILLKLITHFPWTLQLFLWKRSLSWWVSSILRSKEDGPAHTPLITSGRPRSSLPPAPHTGASHGRAL